MSLQPSREIKKCSYERTFRSLKKNDTIKEIRKEISLLVLKTIQSRLHNRNQEEYILDMDNDDDCASIVNRSRNTSTSVSFADTSLHNMSLSSIDSSPNTSFSSRSLNYKHKEKKDRTKRKVRTYRGVDSKSYNSNVRIGKISAFVKAESDTKDRSPLKENAFQHDKDSEKGEERPDHFAADRKSVLSYYSSASRSQTHEPKWHKIISTASAEETAIESGYVEFKALNECAICGKDRIRLKLLHCLHSFCHECLQQHIDSTSRLSLKKCPLCKRKVDIPHNGLDGIEDNIYTQFSEMSISENERCHTCSESVPKCRCSECGLNFCTDCVKDHLYDEKDKPHYIVNVTSEMVGRTSLATECKEHRPFTMNLYCVNCSKLICGRCAIEKHNNHVAEDVEMTANDMRNDLRGMITDNSATRITKEIADHMHRSRKERAKLETDAENAVHAVQLHVKQLKEELEEFETNTIQMIRNKETSLRSTLDMKAKDAETTLRSTQLSLETMKRIVDRARDIELIERFPRLKSLASELRKSVKTPPTQCIRMNYLILVNTLKSSIGRVHFESFLSKPIELRELCYLQLFKHTSSIYPISSSKAWVSFRKYIQLCHKDGSYGVRIDFGEPVVAISGNSNNIIFVACRSSVKVIGSKMVSKFLFQLPHEPSDMKFTEVDGIIISFKEARRLAVFSQKGNLLKELDLRHFGYLLGTRINEPWKIGISEYGDIYLTDFSSNTIAVFDNNFEVKTAFSGNVFRHGCIAFYKGFMFLSDYKRDCVHVYSSDGQLLQTCKTTGIHAPCSIAIDTVGDIWIGSWMGLVKVYAQR